MTIEINFPTQYTFGTVSSTLTPNGNAGAAITVFTLLSNKLSISTGANFALYLSTGIYYTIYLNYLYYLYIADNTLDITGVNNPYSGGIYPIKFTIRATATSTIIYHQTLQPTILPSDLLTPTVTQVTLDTNRPTVFMFSFITSETIPSGGYPYSFTNPTSTISFEFQTGGSCTDLINTGFFATDLGTGVANGGTIPCYGISNISRIYKYNKYLPYLYKLMYIINIKRQQDYLT